MTQKQTIPFKNEKIQKRIRNMARRIWMDVYGVCKSFLLNCRNLHCCGSNLEMNNIEQIIKQVEEALQNFFFEKFDQQTKVEVLNKLNEILYPLKEQNILDDFNFYLYNNVDHFKITLVLREHNQPDNQFWDFEIKKSS